MKRQLALEMFLRGVVLRVVGEEVSGADELLERFGRVGGREENCYGITVRKESEASIVLVLILFYSPYRLD